MATLLENPLGGSVTLGRIGTPARGYNCCPEGLTFHFIEGFYSRKEFAPAINKLVPLTLRVTLRVSLSLHLEGIVSNRELNRKSQMLPPFVKMTADP